MTLNEWRNKYHIALYDRRLATLVFVSNTDTILPVSIKVFLQDILDFNVEVVHVILWELFHLSDYVVSGTASGPSYNLDKR